MLNKCGLGAGFWLFGSAYCLTYVLEDLLYFSYFWNHSLKVMEDNMMNYHNVFLICGVSGFKIFLGCWERDTFLRFTWTFPEETHGRSLLGKRSPPWRKTELLRSRWKNVGDLMMQGECAAFVCICDVSMWCIILSYEVVVRCALVSYFFVSKIPKEKVPLHLYPITTHDATQASFAPMCVTFGLPYFL